MSGTWSIFSSHGLILFYLVDHPHTTLREVSDALGLSERWVGAIIRDLVGAGMVEVARSGRRNFYDINPEATLRHPTLAHIKLKRIIDALAGSVPETS